MLVGTAALAAILSVTPRQVQNLENEGILVKSGAGKWPLTENVKAYVNHRIEAERSRIDRGAGDAMTRALHNQDIASRIETRTRALIADAKIESLAVIDNVAAGLRVDLQALPARVTDDLKLRRQLSDGIDAAFRAAADRAEAEAARVEAAVRLMAADTEDDAGPMGQGKPKLPVKRRAARAKRP